MYSFTVYTVRVFSIQKCTSTKPWQPDSVYPPFGRALHIQQTYFPFSFDLNTYAQWLADRSKVCCSFWIDPLWYQSAKRVAFIYVQNHHHHRWRCRCRRRRCLAVYSKAETSLGKMKTDFTFSTSHHILCWKSMYVCWQDSITLKAFTQLWGIENAQIMNIEFVLTFLPRVILLHIAFLCTSICHCCVLSCAVRCGAVSLSCILY